jgi:type VI protein secretion system component Hcp
MKKQLAKNKAALRDLKPTANPKGGKANLHDITITKPVDKPSPKLS